MIVGLGALGQNICQNLALSGLGHFWLIDFDLFEDHNATRSPFYPDDKCRALLGLAKAPVVSRSVKSIATAVRPEVRISQLSVQEVGDCAVQWADVVVSAVDNANARAWLSERSRLHGKPLVEGGFSAAVFNMSVFSGADGQVCYRCHNPGKVSSASCTRYALQAEAQGIAPAIQSTAAVVGGLMAEQVIEIVEGKSVAIGTRTNGQIRRLFMQKSSLPVNLDCPGEHKSESVLLNVRISPDLKHLRQLAAQVYGTLGAGELYLSEPFHVAYPCVACGALCEVYALESKWLRDSACFDCGGKWRRSNEVSPLTILSMDVAEVSQDTSPIGEIELSVFGLSGDSYLLFERGVERGFIKLEGGEPRFEAV